MKSSSSKAEIRSGFLKTSLKIAGAAALCAAGAFADTVYTVAPLLTPGFSGIQMYQINDSGQVVGFGNNPSGHNETFLATTSASPTAIPVVAGWDSLQGWGVNNSGVVAAGGFNSSYEQAATGTASGSTGIPMPSGGWSNAIGLSVSDTGYVAGYVEAPGASQPFLYNPNTGVTKTIALPTTGGWRTATGIGVNDSGQVTGWVYNGLDYQAFIGTPSTGMTLIPLPTNWISAQGASINDSGQVAGYGYSSSGQSFAFIGTAAGSTVIPLPTGATDAATSSTTTGFLNNAGDVVGDSNAGGWIWNATGGTVLLSTVVPTGWKISDAISISDNGLILALGTYEGGSSQWLELTPQTTASTPEPATMLLSGAGLALVILRRRLLRA